MVVVATDDLVPHDIARSEAVAEEIITKMHGVISVVGGLDTNIPEDLLMVGHDLK